MFLKRLSLGILVGLLSVSCGRSGSRDLKEGYYAFSGDTSTVSYPLIIVKYVGEGTSIFQLSQVDGGGFGAGLSSTGSNSDLWTTVGSSVNDGPLHEGVITQKGNSLRVRALEIARGTYITQESDISKATVLDDNVLDSITKEAALKLLRSLVTTRGSSGKYTDSQEEACQGAFAQSCTALFK